MIQTQQSKSEFDEFYTHPYKARLVKNGFNSKTRVCRRAFSLDQKHKTISKDAKQVWWSSYKNSIAEEVTFK